jgi:uncharacterized protein
MTQTVLGGREPGGLVVTVAVLVSLALLGGVMTHVVPRDQAHLVSAVLAVGCYVVCRIRRNASGSAVTLLALLSSLWALVGVWPRSWTFVPLIPLGLFIGISSVTSLREVVAPWLKRGQLGTSLIPMILATALVSGIGLYLWFTLTDPDVTRARAMVPEGSVLVLVVGGLIFSFVNAIVEEVIFRGVVLGAVASLIGDTWLPVIIQAAVFGHAHFYGFPSGWSGVVLATAYGAILGMMKRRSNGLAAPIAAHVFADMTIFAILVQFTA